MRCEHRARLVAKQAERMAGGDVGEREHPDLGVACDRRRLASGRVAVLVGPLGAPPRRTSPRGRAGRRRGRRSASCRSGACRRRPRACGPAAAAPSPARARPRGSSRRAGRGRSRGPASRPERACRPRDRTARALVLEEDVAERRAAVVDRRPPRAGSRRARARRPARARPVAARSRSRPAIRRTSRHQRSQPRRPVDRERSLAAPQVERLQHPRQPEPVVGVEVGQEDLRKVGQPDRGDAAGAGSPRRSRSGSGRRRGAPAARAGLAEPTAPNRRCRRRRRKGP